MASTTDQNQLVLRIVGVALTAGGLWALSQPTDSILILGVLLGPLILIAPSLFLH
jgi:uncharacterized membrane protein HdeD (DUF308 family)